MFPLEQRNCRINNNFVQLAGNLSSEIFAYANRLRRILLCSVPAAAIVTVTVEYFIHYNRNSYLLPSLYRTFAILLNPLPCTIDWHRLKKVSCLSSSMIRSDNNNNNEQAKVCTGKSESVLRFGQLLIFPQQPIVLSKCSLQTGLGGINLVFGHCQVPYYYLCT